jgi:serine/threonine-protein kinase
MKRFGDFELESRLGRGGNAEVWRATRPGPRGFRRAVALKRLLPERPDNRALLEEARLAAALDHPNVAQVLEVVESGGEHAIVMELVDGCDLRALLKAAPLPPGLGAYVVHEVARALGAAHRHKPIILHRDVSCTNVLIARDGSVKLADFGLGKALADSATDGTASLKGNLAYMAPEQLARGRLSPATDVYAAGVLLWELLTGKRLFTAAFALAEMAAARQSPIAPPSSVTPGVPVELDAICARAMSIGVADRFADGEALADALAPLVHRLGFGAAQLAPGVPDAPVVIEAPRGTITAEPDQPEPPVVPPRRRRRAMWIAGGLIVTAALAVSGWYWAGPEENVNVNVNASGSASVEAAVPGLAPGAAEQSPRSSAPASAVRKRKPVDPRRRTAPDLVDGNLMNPFKR